MSNEWGEIIYYSSGYAFSTLENGQTVNLGKEQEIRACVEDYSKRINNPLIQEIIDQERQAKLERILLDIKEKEAEKVRAKHR